MATLRKKYHELGNKINNALLYIGSVKRDLTRTPTDDERLKQTAKDCEVAERELLTLARELDRVKTITYRFMDPDKDLGLIVEGFREGNQAVRLLFVDDEIELCVLLKRNYTARGFQVETAASLPEAQKKIVANPPDILVLDLYLDQGMEGVEILRFAKKTRPDMKCLVVTREFDEDRLKEVKDLGADGILKKPVMADELEARINGLVSSLRG